MADKRWVSAIPATDARPNCQSSDFQTVCQTNGSVSINARPGTVAPPVVGANR